MTTTATPRAPGETNLATLLSTLRPTLHDETYIFLTIPPTHPSFSPTNAAPLLQALQPRLLFHEPEGIMIITTPGLAETNGFTEYVFECRMISPEVQSSLEAVGLMAAISAALGRAGVSANVASGFYHDHVFVPVGKEDFAMGVF
ncbi:ACT domain-containing protein [Aspergillus aurantiobrunneus]